MSQRRTFATADAEIFSVGSRGSEPCECLSHCDHGSTIPWAQVPELPPTDSG